MASTRVDIAGASTADGARANQWDYLGGASQQWRLVWSGPNVSLWWRAQRQGVGGGRANHGRRRSRRAVGRPRAGQPALADCSELAASAVPDRSRMSFAKPV